MQFDKTLPPKSTLDANNLSVLRQNLRNMKLNLRKYVEYPKTGLHVEQVTLDRDGALNHSHLGTFDVRTYTPVGDGPFPLLVLSVG